MRDFLNIGPVPCDEECAQVGCENYKKLAMDECFKFIDVIRKKLGNEPKGADLIVKAFPHDFGTYYEVVCYYDDQNEKATEYAFKCESDSPTTWK